MVYGLHNDQFSQHHAHCAVFGVEWVFGISHLFGNLVWSLLHGGLPLLLEWSWMGGKCRRQLVKAGAGIEEISLNEFLCDSLSCLDRSGKKFLNMVSISVHKNSISINCHRKSTTCVVYLISKLLVDYVHLPFWFGMGFWSQHSRALLIMVF